MNLINISTSRAFFRWQPSAWLRVGGEDAGVFLQGQFTAELRGLAAGRASYGLWLSVKGKVVADSFVVRGAGENEYWIGSYFSPGTLIRERLESHIIADDVTVEDFGAEWNAVTLFDWPMAAAPREGFVFRGRRGGSEAWEWVYPQRARDDVARELAGAAELGADEMERRRICAGIPKVPNDVGPTDLPNEAGLEVDAISFTKGCYLGQEVMARLKAMGQVRRRLLRVRGRGGDIPNLPAALFAGARQVGELRSAARAGDEFIGLAMLSLLHVAAETRLAFASEGEPRVVVAETP